MNEFKPRITGTEMEWGLLLSNDGAEFRKPGDKELNIILKNDFPEDQTKLRTNSGTMLANGARLYVDIGPHFEYATPEDTSFWGTAANEIAAESVMTALLDRYASHRRNDYRLHRRVVDKNGTTWGYHENYFMPDAKELPSNAASALMVMHLASRQVFTGAGWQMSNGNFSLSQKIPSLRQTFGEETTGGAKPLLNRRDESHTDVNRPGKRMHITSGDANMSPWVTFMKLSTTSIVLRLVELGIQPRARFSYDHAVQAAKFYSTDPGLQSVYELEDRLHNPVKMTALDIQDYLVTLAEQTFASDAGLPPLPEEEVFALAEWRKLIDSLKQDPTSQIGAIEWMTKRAIFEQLIARGEISKPDDLSNIDLQWDAISDRGLARRYRQKRWSPWMNEVLVQERVHTAPPTTRARPRGRFIELASVAAPATSEVGWGYVEYRRLIQLTDPYSSSCGEVEALFAHPPIKTPKRRSA